MKQLQISESKNKGSLVFTGISIYDKLFYGFVMSFILGSILFVAVTSLYIAIKNDNEILFPIFIFLLGIGIFSSLIYALFNQNKLKRVKGLSLNENRSIVKEISEEMDWGLTRHNNQITLLNKSPTWKSTNWGRELYIIYDKGDVLINCFTSGRHISFGSPFHWFSNRKIEKKFTDNFSLKIEATIESAKS